MPPSPADSAAGTGGGERCHDRLEVVVVDDEDEVRALVVRLLRETGISVREFANGLDALAWIRANTDRTGAVVLDVMMPDADGFTVLAELQARPASRSIPVLLLTARATDEVDVVQGLSTGAVYHVPKPFRKRILLAQVERMLVRRREYLEFESRISEAEVAATTDPLTGLGNRRKLDGDLAELAASTPPLGASVAVAILDLDHFKSINDTYGHPEGDRMLAHVANVIRNHLPDRHSGFRVGGEEFVLLLRGYGGPEAVSLVEKIRAALKRQPFRFRTGDAPVVTFSAGIAAAATSAGAEKALLERADRALYLAKHQGRDRIELEPRAPLTVPRWSTLPPAG